MRTLSIEAKVRELADGRFIGVVVHLRGTTSQLLGQSLTAGPVTVRRRAALAAAIRKARTLR